MNNEELRKLLNHITVQLNKTVGHSKFFKCWENTDRRWVYDDGKIDYILSSDVDELTKIFIHFLYDPQSDKLQFIRSSRDDDVIWETENASQLTKKSDFSELCKTFRSQMAFWYDCLLNIKRINDNAAKKKEYYYHMLDAIAKDIFKYDIDID